MLFVLRRRLSTQTLIGGPGLTPNGVPGGWRASSDQPMWLLPVGAKTPYLELRFAARILSRPDVTRAGKWQIYYDSGEGFLQSQSRTFRFHQDQIEIRAIMRLRKPAVAFRIDPTDFPCEFVVDRFELIALRRLAAWPGLGAERFRTLHRSGVLGASFKRSLHLLAAGRPARAFETLFGPFHSTPALYEQWVEARKTTEMRRVKFIAKAEKFNYRPTFSVIMPTYNSTIEFLEKSIASVKSQTYPYWELCIADDGSTNEEVRKVILEHAKDPRVKTVFLKQNVGISKASNAALGLACGEYIALFDHDDELAPHALHAFAAALNEHPEADWLYSDEDKIDAEGRRTGPLFKPDWSPAFFQACIVHLPPRSLSAQYCDRARRVPFRI